MPGDDGAEGVLAHRRVADERQFWPARRRQRRAGALILIFIVAFASFTLWSAFDRESANGPGSLLWWLPLGACAIGLRVGIWLFTRRLVLIIDLAKGRCALRHEGVPPPWPIREVAHPFSLSLDEVQGFAVLSRPLIDRLAPPGRLWHGVAVETRAGGRHDLGWDFLDDARAAALAADALNAATMTTERAGRIGDEGIAR
jgi:hypothetical protein